MESTWSPGANFSPTKAREQLAQAKDWKYIDTWLCNRYGNRTPPSFERNSDTLRALLALAAHNESADEKKELVAQVEVKALAELKAEAEADPHAAILKTIEQNLTPEGRQSLDSIASLSVALNTPSVESEQLALGIIDLTRSEYNLQQQSRRLSTIQSNLGSELSKLRTLLVQVQSEAFSAPATLPQKTTEWTRGTKLLSAKLLDYRERLTSLSGVEAPEPTIPHIVAQEQDVMSLKAQVRGLEGQVKAFQGLPYDKELATLEVERARRELVALVLQRDNIFEGLVEKGGGGAGG
ncbi:MAG: hypothetical protein M1827_001657 [Pycnora praestabilis]|nr:MAG: hypothetical protein M1827_001657 [Pycnora praestabilis]